MLKTTLKFICFAFLIFGTVFANASSFRNNSAEYKNLSSEFIQYMIANVVDEELPRVFQNKEVNNYLIALSNEGKYIEGSTSTYKAFEALNSTCETVERVMYLYTEDRKGDDAALLMPKDIFVVSKKNKLKFQEELSYLYPFYIACKARFYELMVQNFDNLVAKDKDLKNDKDKAVQLVTNIVRPEIILLYTQTFEQFSQAGYKDIHRLKTLKSLTKHTETLSLFLSQENRSNIIKMFHSIKYDSPDIAKQVATISKKLTSQICSTFCMVKDVH